MDNANKYDEKKFGWPDALEQQEKSLIYLYRVKSWKPLIEEIVYFATQYCDAQSKVFDASSKLFKFIDSSNEIPSCDAEDLIKLRVLFKSILDGQKANHSSFRTIHSSTQKLRSDGLKSIKHFISETETLLLSIKRQREASVTAIRTNKTAYETICTKKSSDSRYIDPWLSEKALKHEVEQLAVKENDARKKLIKLHQDMRDFETSMIHSMTSILSGILSASTHNNFLQKLQSLKEFSSSKNGTKSFDDYCKEHNLVDSKCFTPNMTSEDYAFILPDCIRSNKEAIELQDVFDRPGDYFQSAFKPCLIVVTNAGFLHCFSLTSSADPIEVVKQDLSKLKFSINLKAPKILAETSNLNMNCILIKCPRKSNYPWRSPFKNYLIKSKTETQMKNLLDIIGKHLLMNRERYEIEE